MSTTQPTPAQTPRTDAMQASGKAHYMSLDLARALERELTSAQAELAAKDAEIAELSEQLRIIVDAESFRARKIERERDGFKARAEKAEAELADLRHQHASVFRMLGIPENDFGELENFFIRAADTRAERDQLCAELESAQAALAAAQQDKKRLDVAEKYLVSLSRLTAPDMGGLHFVGQYFNPAKERGEAGPSYLRWEGSTLRAAIDAARGVKT